MRKLRIAFVNTHPIQYFAPLYAYLNALDDVSITALYLSDYSIRGDIDKAFGQVVKWDVDLLAGYDARFVAGASKRSEATGFFSMIAPGLWGEILRGNFDALIVHGHTPVGMLVGIAAAKALGVPVFMRCETHLGLQRSPLKAALRRVLIGALYTSLEGVFAIGAANADFYRAMGVPKGRIFSMPYTVDNARFTAASRITEGKRTEIRARFGIRDTRPLILYSAKLQARKRPADLLQAAARLQQDGVLFHLLIVGSGEQEAELRDLSCSKRLKNVSFAGFVNQSTLPQIYAASDLFVLPSENEPWGLAINEAMCAGLPIVASQEIGCVPDLVKDGINGRTFPVGNIIVLADVLRDLVQGGQTLNRMGEASREIISHWSYADCRDGLREAITAVGLQTKLSVDQGGDVPATGGAGS